MPSNRYSRPRRAVRPMLTVLAGAAIAATVLGAGVADAHSYVTHAEPADGAVLPAGPPQVCVTFNEKVEDPVMNVTGPDGKVWSQGGLHIDGRTHCLDLAPLGPAGVYTTQFTVTSKDGHRIEGTRSFTLTQPGPGAPPQQ
ncbi:copper resistance protein CopC [Nocardia sp. NPDC020380]|uniref:copper resistance protein CopC n=1 Tax=Nocardia sp. NPDC020380 TaxID=3364309 RepID=UPI0037AA5906